jgi:hypothetical protein
MELAKRAISSTEAGEGATNKIINYYPSSSSFEFFCFIG